MDLPHTLTKTLSIATFFGLFLSPLEAELAIGPDPAAPSKREAMHALAAETPAAPRGLEKPVDGTAPNDQDASACPTGMILVDGDHCPDVEQTCLKWLDPPPYENTRCGEYAKPAKCKVSKVHKRFCVDREEYSDGRTNAAGVVVPTAMKSWVEAKALCEARGARLCKESEWELACEGPEMSPYPYGWSRDMAICNTDRTDLGAPDKLIDHRAAITAFPKCVSPFGVHHMVGNVDEWTERENGTPPYRSALRGGWWLPGRNRCRAATLFHDESYAAKQVGFRCCKDH